MVREKCYRLLKNRFPHMYSYLKKNKVFPCLYHIPDSVYMHKRKKAVQKHGYYVVRKMYDISKYLGIPVWIDCGTLLGYCREGMLMKHDYDIDFASWSLDEEKRKRLIGTLKKEKMLRVRGVSLDGVPYTDSFEYKGVIFDINYYFGSQKLAYYFEHNTNEQKGMRFYKGKIRYEEGFDIYKYTAANLKPVKGVFLNGCPCIIPQNPVRRTVEMYGENWMVPIIEDYDWTIHTDSEYMGFNCKVRGWSRK